MTYRAPVAEMVFSMRHAAGLDRAIADGIRTADIASGKPSVGCQAMGAAILARL